MVCQQTSLFGMLSVLSNNHNDSNYKEMTDRSSCGKEQYNSNATEADGCATVSLRN